MATSFTLDMADALGGDNPEKSGQMLTKLREELKMTRAEFSRLVGLSEGSIGSWEKGNDLKPASLRTIVEVGRLCAHLSKAFGASGNLGDWLKAPNPGFGGLKPLEVIERGQIDRVWRMVYRLESGMTS